MKLRNEAPTQKMLKKKNPLSESLKTKGEKVLWMS
jgi:hypothetical protein